MVIVEYQPYLKSNKVIAFRNEILYLFSFSSSLCVQTGSGAHPAFCTMGAGGSFPGDKVRPGRDADHSPPTSAEVVNE
jgi:hypothetical protein